MKHLVKYQAGRNILTLAAEENNKPGIYCPIADNVKETLNTDK